MLTDVPGRWRAAAAILGVALSVGGCASYGQGSAYGDHANGYGVDFYEPFDNSRDYGPSYLVGPPNHAQLFPNDEGARSSGKTLQLLPKPDAAPSIPSAPQDRDKPSPSLPPSPVE
jgi:hypothetical protein